MTADNLWLLFGSILNLTRYYIYFYLASTYVSVAFIHCKNNYLIKCSSFHFNFLKQILLQSGNSLHIVAYVSKCAEMHSV